MAKGPEKVVVLLVVAAMLAGGLLGVMALSGQQQWAWVAWLGDSGSDVLHYVLVGVVGLGVLAVLARIVFKVLAGTAEAPASQNARVERRDLAISPNTPISALPTYVAELRQLLLMPDLSAVDLLNYLLSVGFSLSASDIHMVPGRSTARVTVRIHGMLYTLGEVPQALYPTLVIRVKVVSNLTIYHKNRPQDGRMRFADPRYTARVSVLPTSHGEKLVLRLAARQGNVYELCKVGFSPDVLALYKALLNRNQGVVVLTGPTGSGKTTTLYASLQHIHRTRGESLSIVTLEDPIENEFTAFSQTQIEPAAGLTFAAGLRSVLRQDPDVIMLGEIRDDETATNAMRAAMTGHLILTTVHADNTAGVFGRLVQIGIDRVQLSSALCAVVAQRLCPRICPACRQEEPLSDAQRQQLALLGVDDPPEGPFWRSPGCDACVGKGLVGRMALFEVLTVDNQIRDLVAGGAPVHHVHEAAVRAGMRTLLQDGLLKAARGDVLLDDVLRVASA